MPRHNRFGWIHSGRLGWNRCGRLRDYFISPVPSPLFILLLLQILKCSYYTLLIPLFAIPGILQLVILFQTVAVVCERLHALWSVVVWESMAQTMCTWHCRAFSCITLNTTSQHSSCEGLQSWQRTFTFWPQTIPPSTVHPLTLASSVFAHLSLEFGRH